MQINEETSFNKFHVTEAPLHSSTVHTDKFPIELTSVGLAHARPNRMMHNYGKWKATVLLSEGSLCSTVGTTWQLVVQ